jgi:aryl-alcohol dehydrogenase-like predicted oxidoreductase
MFGVGSIPWSPLARGVACRPWKATTARTESDPMMFMYKHAPGVEDIVERRVPFRSLL